MALVLVFVTGLGLAYNASLAGIHNRLKVVESIDDLGAAIAEMRRAEKNYLLYLDSKSAREWTAQVARARRAISTT